MKKTRFTALVACAVLTLASTASATTISNASFETGNFNGWTTQDLANPFDPLQVAPAGTVSGFGFFNTAPTDGVFSALHGFDGGGPGTIRVGQDITVTAGGSLMDFDWRAAWNVQGFGATQARIFDVNVEVAGGGANLQSTNFLTIFPNTTANMAIVTGTVNLTPFIGQTVRLSFDFFVPENFTGPAAFELDNLVARLDPNAPAVPEPTTIVLLSLGAACVSLGYRRRKKRKPTA